ncbi:MAG: ribosome maturation factor RimM [Cardiobacteriaceae bacterium]|nr:ribosome maturation factor RimM [Cardiobacteriaceae bacterium]
MSHDTADIIVGRIVGVHGIRGQVKVHSDCRPRESLFQYKNFIARQDNHPEISLQLLRGQITHKGLIATFSNISDRDQAMTLRGYTLSITRSQLPQLKGDQFYWTDLIGMRIENRQGIILGKVKELFETGANDVLVVEKTGSHNEMLIPFIRPRYIEQIDLNNKVIHVDWEIGWSETSEDERK